MSETNTVQQEVKNQLPAKQQAVAFRTNYTARQLYVMDVEKLPCLFGDIIPSAGLWTLVGSSDTGKSMLLRQLALNCAKGEPFIGWPNNAKHKRSIFISTEDDAASTSYLVRRQAASEDDLDNLRFHFTTNEIPSLLEEELKKQPADLVIIDAWSDIFGQDLKDSNLIRKTLNVYNEIAGYYHCSICFLHHTGKRTERLEPSKNNILSGQGYEAKMRLVIELKADNADKYMRHLCIVKGNYLGEEYKHASYVLQFNPETFTFTNTESRVPFMELGSAPEQPQGAPQPENHRFGEIPADMHKVYVFSVFKNHGGYMRYAELYNALGVAYSNHAGESFGRTKFQRLLNYLVENNYIEKCGTPGAAWYKAVSMQP